MPQARVVKWIMSARHKISRSGPEGVFERKVLLSKWALLFEQIWPRAWLILGLAGLFIAVSVALVRFLLRDPPVA